MTPVSVPPEREQQSARRGSLQEDSWWYRHRRLVGFTGAVIAAGMAVLWTFVVPAKAATVTGWQEIAIRWGHPLCWALLAAVGMVFAVDGPRRLRNALAQAAALAYAAFLAGTLL